jgi:hypothetical protein
MPYRPPEQVGAPRTKSGGAPQKYFLDDKGRKLILELYDGTTERTSLIAKSMPLVPRCIIHRWARELGVAHSRVRSNWTYQEEEYLRKNIGKVTYHHLEKKLKKSRMNIYNHAQELGLIKEKAEDYYSLSDIIVSLHAHEKTVRAWIDKGWLKGRKDASGYNWVFRNRDIREFIFAHPSEINPRKLDHESWLWIVDILSGEIGIGELGQQMRGEKE